MKFRTRVGRGNDESEMGDFDGSEFDELVRIVSRARSGA